jgi:serine/threonine-protein kinase
MKPENVFLVRRRGREHFVKLLDFGIAKLRDGRAGSTTTGCVVGTPEYMAPEQCEDGPVDARTDVYAVGVMAFELVTGRLPFDGRNVTQLLLAQLREEPPRPSALAPVHPELERAILRALEKDPAARFQSMDELAAALAAAPFERTRRASPASAIAIAPTATLTPVPAAAPAATPIPSALAALAAEMRAPGAAPARLAVAELTRGGLFLRADAALPPLLSRVTVVLTHPSLKGELELGAEVVRHVSAADAGAWRMPPGFAVQFESPPPEARAALAALADEARGDAPPSVAPRASAPSPGERLAELEARRAAADPYAMLGVAPDAEFAELRRAIRALRDELEGLRARPLAPDHPARATALLASVEAAQDAVGSPAARLSHDARTGNRRGVDRCLRAGVPAPLVEARRRELLAAEPRRAAEAERHLSRAEVARKLGNAAAAAAAYEAALSADPLDPRARDAYAAFRRTCPAS